MTCSTSKTLTALVAPLLTLASSLIAVSGSSVHADTITVCPSGCDYSDIQMAVDAAGPGDVVQIAAGTYLPGSTITVTESNVTLRGELASDGTCASILNGQGSIRLLAVSGDSVTIEQLCLRDGLGQPYPVFSGVQIPSAGGLLIEGNSVSVLDCSFEGSSAAWGGGALSAGDYSSFIGCDFSANQAAIGGGLVVFSSPATLEDCSMIGNSASQHGGGLGVLSGAVTCVGGSFSGNDASQQGGGAYAAGDALLDLESVQFTLNTAGSGTALKGINDSTVVVAGSLFEGNGPNGGGEACLLLDSDSTGTIEGSTVCGNQPSTQIDGGWTDLGGNCISAVCLDSDLDGVLDCYDGCPDDFDKIEPGDCGCGEAETDADLDGIADCNDDCIQDLQLLINEQEPGAVLELPAGTYLLDCRLELGGRSITIRGALDEQGRPATVLDAQHSSTILNASATKDGVLVLENLVFQNAAAFGLFDGAISVNDRAATIANCEFLQNYTAAISCIEARVEVEGCRFVDNACTCRFSGASPNGLPSVIRQSRFEESTGNLPGNIGPVPGYGLDVSMLGASLELIDTVIIRTDYPQHSFASPSICADGDSSLTLLRCRITGDVSSPSTQQSAIVGVDDVLIEQTTICGVGPDPVQADWTDVGTWPGNCIEVECSDCTVPGCLGDFTQDGSVEGDDLAYLLAEWGCSVGCAADLDGDGSVGGADLTMLLGTWGVCTTPGICGDGTCDPDENDVWCSEDCSEVCGNGVCEPNESRTSGCPDDCGASCGDGNCDPDETCETCPPDCLEDYCCGDGVCAGVEDCYNCPTDCTTGCPYCGDGYCEDGGPFAEDCSTCPQDCDVTEYFDCHCGDGVCQPVYGEDCVNCGDCDADDGCPTCGDGICTPWIDETPTSCPTDCFCGDGICQDGYEDCETCIEDCADPDCVPICGDGYCSVISETCLGCPQDCLDVLCPSCGDGVCDDWPEGSYWEDCASCPEDCAPECPCPEGEILACDGSGECYPDFELGDGYCEDALCCYAGDGGDCTEGECPVVCGDGVCHETEDPFDCPDDCFCGDGVCDNDYENCPSCIADCIDQCPYCGDGYCENGGPFAEDCSTCPEDCDVSQSFDCHCGDGLCMSSYGENCLNCDDCRDPNWTCGDGICDCLEFTSGSCPDDCD